MPTLSTLLVTGGCGYLGSQLLRTLAASLGESQSAPLTIRVLDNLHSGQIRALMDLPDQATYEFLESDLLDPSALRYAMRGVDAVIHLAAIVRTPLSFDNPAWLEQINHWGTAQLIEAALASGVHRVILTSTAAVYGPGGPYVETSRCLPQGPYAQSKLAAEEVMLTARQRGLEPTILRVGTLFGLAPVTRFDAVANRFAYQAGVRHPITLFGDGEQLRPFIHVRDAADAIVHALTHGLPAPVYNLVGTTASVRTVVEAIQASAPQTAVHYTEQDIRTHYSFDVRNTRLVDTGWEPRVSLAHGLGELIARFRSLHRHQPFAGDLDEL